MAFACRLARKEQLTPVWVAVCCCALLVGCGGQAAPTDSSQSYERLKLEVSAGYGPTPCSNGKDSYEVTRARAQLTWVGCDYQNSPAESVMGQRSLTKTELESVNEALSKVSASSKLNCGADASVLTLDVATASSVEHYADDFYSGCPWQVHAGRTFVTGLGELSRVLSKLRKQ